MRYLLLFLLLFSVNAEAATQLKKTVKPSGGDYTSLEACMNANEQNLVTADKYFDVEIDGSWSSADTTAVTIHNYTTDSTRYINIYTTSAARHQGVWSTSYYNLTLSGENTNALSVSTPNTKIVGLQIKNTHATASIWSRALSVSASDFLIDKSICVAVGGRAVVFNYDTLGQNNQIRNTVALNNSSVSTIYFEGEWNDATGHLAYNCISVNLGSGYGFERNTYQSTAKNCYAYSGSGTAWDAGITLTTCASDDGSASTSTIAYSTDTFTNVTAGSENFHLVAGSGLINIGTDLSAVFTDDIDGNTRPTGANTWDIGADEYVAAGGASTSLPMENIGGGLGRGIGRGMR